jgi:hypothetical protein
LSVDGWHLVVVRWALILSLCCLLISGGVKGIGVLGVIRCWLLLLVRRAGAGFDDGLALLAEGTLVWGVGLDVETG